MKRLNFGCGTDIREGWDNCDIQKAPGVIQLDANTLPYTALKDNTYDYIELREVLNVLTYPDEVLFELRKKCKKNGKIYIEVPYHNNKGAHNDLQVKHYFNDDVFKIFVEQRCVINKQPQFKIDSIELTPTTVGKWIPRHIRERLALFIGGLLSKVKVTLLVVK